MTLSVSYGPNPGFELAVLYLRKNFNQNLCQKCVVHKDNFFVDNILFYTGILSKSERKDIMLGKKLNFYCSKSAIIVSLQDTTEELSFSVQCKKVLETPHHSLYLSIWGGSDFLLYYCDVCITAQIYINLFLISQLKYKNKFTSS